MSLQRGRPRGSRVEGRRVRGVRRGARPRGLRADARANRREAHGARHRRGGQARSGGLDGPGVPRLKRFAEGSTFRKPRWSASCPGKRRKPEKIASRLAARSVVSRSAVKRPGLTDRAVRSLERQVYTLGLPRPPVQPLTERGAVSDTRNWSTNCRRRESSALSSLSWFLQAVAITGARWPG